MKIHYFQRYHTKENVATANTMLLLSRIYNNSTDKFFIFLKELLQLDSFEPELIFEMQTKTEKSVPDALIMQDSFKIVVETKLTKKYILQQLENHLLSFKNERFKILLTIAPRLMSDDDKFSFEQKLKDFNEKHNTNISHINTTFDYIIGAIQDILDDNDYELQDILGDYINYCFKDELILNSENSSKLMKVRLVNTSYDLNITEDLYFDDIKNGFTFHKYLGLYKEKSVKAIGKIEAIVTAEFVNGDYKFNYELGKSSDKYKNKILKAIEVGKTYQYTMEAVRFFIVDKFYETDFKKISAGAIPGSKMFDLQLVLETSNLPRDTNEIAQILKQKTWI